MENPATWNKTQWAISTALDGLSMSEPQRMAEQVVNHLFKEHFLDGLSSLELSILKEKLFKTVVEYKEKLKQGYCGYSLITVLYHRLSE